MADVKYLSKYTLLPSGLDAPTLDIGIDGFGSPKGAFLYIYGLNSEVDQFVSYGFWDGTNQHCVGWNVSDSLLTCNTSRTHRSDKILCVPDLDGSGYLREYSISNSASGIILTLDSSSRNSPYYGNILIFYGQDLNCNVGSFNLPPSGGTISITDMSQKPNAIIFASTALSGVNINNDMILSTGMAVETSGTIVQRGSFIFDQDNLTTYNRGHYISTQQCIGKIYNDALLYTSKIDSFNNDGFTISSDYGYPSGELVSYLSFSSNKIRIFLQDTRLRWYNRNAVNDILPYLTTFPTKLCLGMGGGATRNSVGGSLDYNTIYTQYTLSIGIHLFNNPVGLDARSIVMGCLNSPTFVGTNEAFFITYNSLTLFANLTMRQNTHNGVILYAENIGRSGNGRYFFLCFEDKQQALRFGNKLLLVR